MDVSIFVETTFDDGETRRCNIGRLHCAPDELRRLQAELGARHSYRDAARLIEMFLPRSAQLNTTAPNRLGRIADELGHDLGAPASDYRECPSGEGTIRSTGRVVPYIWGVGGTSRPSRWNIKPAVRKPPSTFTVVPLTCEASSEARKATMLAISSGVP